MPGSGIGRSVFPLQAAHGAAKPDGPLLQKGRGAAVGKSEKRGGGFRWRPGGPRADSHFFPKSPGGQFAVGTFRWKSEPEVKSAFGAERHAAFRGLGGKGCDQAVTPFGKGAVQRRQMAGPGGLGNHRQAQGLQKARHEGIVAGAGLAKAGPGGALRPSLHPAWLIRWTPLRNSPCFPLGSSLYKNT